MPIVLNHLCVVSVQVKSSLRILCWSTFETKVKMVSKLKCDSSEKAVVQAWLRCFGYKNSVKKKFSAQILELLFRIFLSTRQSIRYVLVNNVRSRSISWKIIILFQTRVLFVVDGSYWSYRKVASSVGLGAMPCYLYYFMRRFDI